MAVREVLLYPDVRLKRVASPAQTGEAERVGRDLADTVDALGHCVGLAAPQIAEDVRIVIVDITGHPRAAKDGSNGRLLLVNPRIVEASGREVGREGCLSIPDLTANVARSSSIVVEHAGGRVESSGFEARCLQHEIDHLDGLLFLDRVASIVDDVFRRKSYGA